MATAAFIAARKALLAELLAAHISLRDDALKPAIIKLNAAKNAGDTGLNSIAASLTPVVLALNLYSPILLALIAETDAMVPDDPPLLPPTIENFRVVSG